MYFIKLNRINNKKFEERKIRKNKIQKCGNNLKAINIYSYMKDYADMQLNMKTKSIIEQRNL